jgi:2-dehydro-3-deoxyphosphogluconate aldolase/(4S)-4-hydroxy-2-oxoglutarate aldolase
MKQNKIREVLSKHPVIPVVTFHAVEEVAPKMDQLIARGIFCIEITLRTPAAFECIAEAKRLYGDRCSIGMGTVVSVSQIDKAVELGIDFLVSPGLNATLAPAFEASGIAFIPYSVSPLLRENKVGPKPTMYLVTFTPNFLAGSKCPIS